MVIVKISSQHHRLRVSRPDQGLADRSDWPVCGLAAAHKHTLQSRCYFYPVCSPHPDLSHGHWLDATSGPRVYQTALKSDRKCRPFWVTGSHPACPDIEGNVQCLASFRKRQFKECTCDINWDHCTIFSLGSLEHSRVDTKSTKPISEVSLSSVERTGMG